MSIFTLTVCKRRVILNIQEVQDFIATAVGGENIGEQLDGRARFPSTSGFRVNAVTRWRHYKTYL